MFIVYKIYAENRENYFVIEFRSNFKNGPWNERSITSYAKIAGFKNRTKVKKSLKKFKYFKILIFSIKKEKKLTSFHGVRVQQSCDHIALGVPPRYQNVSPLERLH